MNSGRLFVWFYLSLLAKTSLALDGVPDSSFAINGNLRFLLGDENYGNTIGICPDQSIVTSGSYFYDSLSTIRIVYFSKHLPDGSPDITFGQNGILDSVFVGHYAGISKLKILPGGKILAIGSNGSGILLRLNANGTVDSAFGTNGVANIRTSAGLDFQSNGKIIASGAYFDGFHTFFCVERCFPDGSPDSSFATNGFSTADISPERFDINYAIKVQSDDKILLAGVTYSTGSDERTLLVRYNANGSLDSAFGISGVVTTPVGNAPGYGRFSDVDIQSDGKIVVAGEAQYAPGNRTGSLVVRYNADGTLDNTFGTNGITIESHATNGNSSFNAVQVLPNGEIIAAGTTGLGFWTIQSYTTCMRFNSAGILDTNFANNGIFLSNMFNAVTNTAYDLIAGANGKIYLIGIASDTNTSNQKGVAVICLKDNSAVGIEEDIQISPNRIYPNPARDEFVIDNISENSTVEIYNLIGQQIKIENNSIGNNKIRIRLRVSAGVYFVRIGDGRTKWTQKLVVY